MLLDTFVALTAGFITIPACFAYGIEPGAGPSLIFITLPNIFAQMSGGRIWAFLFFLFLTFAALSTILLCLKIWLCSIWNCLAGEERRACLYVQRRLSF